MKRKEIECHMAHILEYCQDAQISFSEGIIIFQSILATMCLYKPVPREYVKKILAGVLRTYDQNIDDGKD